VTPILCFSLMSRVGRGIGFYYSNTPFQSRGSLTVKTVCSSVLRDDPRHRAIKSFPRRVGSTFLLFPSWVVRLAVG